MIEFLVKAFGPPIDKPRSRAISKGGLMKKSLPLTFGALVVGSWSLLAGPAPCSIHPKKGASKAELESMAKVSPDDARKAALASLQDPSKATVKQSELEAEHGCLVYSFDIAIEGRS